MKQLQRLAILVVTLLVFVKKDTPVGVAQKLIIVIHQHPVVGHGAIDLA